MKFKTLSIIKIVTLIHTFWNQKIVENGINTILYPTISYNLTVNNIDGMFGYNISEKYI